MGCFTWLKTQPKGQAYDGRATRLQDEVVEEKAKPEGLVWSHAQYPYELNNVHVKYQEKNDFFK